MEHETTYAVRPVSRNGDLFAYNARGEVDVEFAIEWREATFPIVIHHSKPLRASARDRSRIRRGFVTCLVHIHPMVFDLLFSSHLASSVFGELWYNTRNKSLILLSMATHRYQNVILSATSPDTAARDVLENQIYKRDPETLRTLLKDRSTGQNIRWATRDYLKFGTTGFHEWDCITLSCILNNAYIIQPRIDKSATEQRARSIAKAEVFTPSWVCNRQNNLVDAAWFGRANAGFNVELDSGEIRWKTIEKPIRFSKNKPWQKYVKAPRLEVSCGEAPYLTSRYDTVSGVTIPPADRIGLLDRKLRVVSENTSCEKDWRDWALSALQSTYGYEYQGDNVLLARENLLYTVREHFIDSFGYELPIVFERQCAEVLSWNVWQMDGIKYVVPGTCHPTRRQPNLYTPVEEEVIPCPGCKDNSPLKHNGIRCRIMVWEAKTEVLFIPPFDFESIVNEKTT